jgi:hypothetical protein
MVVQYQYHKFDPVNDNLGTGQVCVSYVLVHIFVTVPEPVCSGLILALGDRRDSNHDHQRSETPGAALGQDQEDHET